MFRLLHNKGVKLKDMRGLYSTIATLEGQLNATRRKNEVLTHCLAIAKAENEKLHNCVESIETEMVKVKDLVFLQHSSSICSM